MKDRKRRSAVWAGVGLLAFGVSSAQAQPVKLPKGPPPLPLPTPVAPPLPAPPLPAPVPVAPPGYTPAPPPIPVPPPPVAVQPAPPPYYEGPPQAPTYYQPPQAPAPSQPLALPWEPGLPVPEGYMPSSKPAAGYLGIGIGMLSVGWVTSAVVGGVLSDSFKQTAASKGLSPDALTPLYFPVAGPFVTAAMLKAGPGETGLLVGDGILQVAGAVAIVVGSLKRSYRLLRTAPETGLVLSPVVGPGYAGFSGTF